MVFYHFPAANEKNVQKLLDFLETCSQGSLGETSFFFLKNLCGIECLLINSINLPQAKIRNIGIISAANRSFVRKPVLKKHPFLCICTGFIIIFSSVVFCFVYSGDCFIRRCYAITFFSHGYIYIVFELQDIFLPSVLRPWNPLGWGVLLSFSYQFQRSVEFCWEKTVCHSVFCTEFWQKSAARSEAILFNLLLRTCVSLALPPPA